MELRCTTNPPVKSGRRDYKGVAWDGDNFPSHVFVAAGRSRAWPPQVGELYPRHVTAGQTFLWNAQRGAQPALKPIPNGCRRTATAQAAAGALALKRRGGATPSPGRARLRGQVAVEVVVGSAAILAEPPRPVHISTASGAKAPQAERKAEPAQRSP